MIRGKGWKFIRYDERQEYLYNLTEDPGEINNVANEPDHRSHRDKLVAKMDRWLRRTGWPG